MSKAKHTPGPWSRDKYGNVVDSSGHNVHMRGFSTYCAGSEEDIAEAEANTDLAAMAPELLEALEGVEKRCSSMGYVGVDGQYLKVVRSVIAKARGQQ